MCTVPNPGNTRYSKISFVRYGMSVADDWQRKGLGTALMKQLIQSARGNGVKHLYSMDLADNAGMRALAEEFGMSASRDPGNPQQTIYSLALLGQNWGCRSRIAATSAVGWTEEAVAHPRYRMAVLAGR